MKKFVKIALSLLTAATVFSAGVAYSQFWNETPPVVHLTKAEIDSIYNALPDVSRNQDQPAFITDLGPYNLGLNTQHRATAEENSDPKSGVLFHSRSTEVYYIVEGAGTLTTVDGAMTPVKMRNFSKEENYKRLTDTTLQFNAPSGFATFTGTPVERRFGPDDILIIPPNTGHWLSKIDGKYVRYLVFRIDPYRTMPAGYVNPLFRQQGKTTPAQLGPR